MAVGATASFDDVLARVVSFLETIGRYVFKTYDYIRFNRFVYLGRFFDYPTLDKTPLLLQRSLQSQTTIEVFAPWEQAIYLLNYVKRAWVWRGSPVYVHSWTRDTHPVLGAMLKKFDVPGADLEEYRLPAMRRTPKVILHLVPGWILEGQLLNQGYFARALDNEASEERVILSERKPIWDAWQSMWQNQPPEQTWTFGYDSREIWQQMGLGLVYPHLFAERSLHLSCLHPEQIDRYADQVAGNLLRNETG